MRNLNDKNLIISVVDEIMTDMFFIFPDLDDEGQQVTQGVPSEASTHVGIHFNTDFYLHFQIDNTLLAEMAANFMGISPDELTQEHIESMACETANIIGGNYLVRADPEAEFKLSIPEILNPKSIQDSDKPEEHWSIAFVADGRVLSVSPYKRNG
jgi:CheY-specific phosphatase CheX